MQQITGSSTLPLISPADRVTLNAAKRSLVGEDLIRPLPEETRYRLQIFVGTVDRLAALPATAAQIGPEIAALMINFRSMSSVSRDEAAAIVREYTGVLIDQPLWAIREGFRRIKNAEVPGLSLDFPPAAPRLKTVVIDVMRPLLADRYDVRRILNARIAPLENPDAAERAKRLAFIQSFGPTPSHGIGGTPANEIGRSDMPAKPISEVMSRLDVLAHYTTQNLGFAPKPKRDDDRNEDRYDGGVVA